MLKTKERSRLSVLKPEGKVDRASLQKMSNAVVKYTAYSSRNKLIPENMSQFFCTGQHLGIVHKTHYCNDRAWQRGGSQSSSQLGTMQ